MKVPGLPALALALSSLLVIAWSVSAASCKTPYTFVCTDTTGIWLGDVTSDDLACPCINSCCLEGPLNGVPYPQPGIGYPVGGGTCSTMDAGDIGTCGSGTLLCGQDCTNPKVDPMNCGSCGHDCEGGTCQGAVCQ